MAQLYANNSKSVMGLFNQRTLQDVFPVLIRKLRGVVYSQLCTVKTRKPSQLNFESVGTHLDFIPYL